MSQAAPAPAPAPATSRAAAPDTAGPTSAGARTVDVPALLNRWQVIAVALCLLFGALTATLQVLSWHANRAAADNTEQLVRVQSIQSTLLRADALATSAFLIGGLEPPAQRATYDAAIDEVARQVAEAAEAQPADREALAALNEAVTGYATTITQARDNNRQGFPVGSAYLSGASSQLRTDVLPIVSALVAANSQRAVDEMGAQRPYLIVLPGLFALAGLWGLNRRLAAVFRRRFNLGLAAAFVGVGVLTLVALLVSTGQRDDNDQLQSDSYRIAVQEATARSAANDARSNESLRLINRGSGAANEAAYAQARERVTGNATADTLGLWRTYDTVHDDVVAQDEQGQWDQAVARATSFDDGDSTATFEAFDAAAQDTVDAAARAATSTLREGNSAILVLSVVSLLVGLGAAGACTWGIAARRKEYA